MSRFMAIVALGVATGLAFAAGTSSANPDMALKKAHEGKDVVTTEAIQVDKATGSDAYTVAEIHAKGSKLDRKKVSVRGKVVKVSAGIMNRNWVHLRDGSGDAAKGTHNLVVTTQDAPSVGDVVTAKGVLAKDKDFGAGYVYPVIVEEAKVRK